jgi:SpoIID/LytB domain protein
MAIRQKRFKLSFFAALVLSVGSGLFVTNGGNLAGLNRYALHAWALPLPSEVSAKEEKPANLPPYAGNTAADTIKVGIARDGLTGYIHPAVTLQATGSGVIQVLDDKNLPVWHGAQAVTIKRLAQNSWQLQVVLGKSAANTVASSLLSSPPAPPLVVSSSALIVTSAVMPIAKPTAVAEATSALSSASFISLPWLKRPGGKPYYRGIITLTPDEKSLGLYVVNTLPMQDYLKAVVPNEMPVRFGFEAVKAQAVAARNYALRPRDTFWKTFDICDSQYCQAYYGAQTEAAESNRAITETQGLVLLFNHHYALTLFSSTAGGVSAAYDHAFSDPQTFQFPAPPIAYLTGQYDPLVATAITKMAMNKMAMSKNAQAVAPSGSTPDLSSEAAARAFWTRQDLPSFDSASPYYRWTRSWQGADLHKQITGGLLKVSRDATTRRFINPLFTHAAQLGTLKRIEVVQRSATGKAMVMEVISSAGKWRIQKELLIRQVLNINGKILPSGNVVLTNTTNAKGFLQGLVAEGGGLGHGVGLSQYGASGMDRAGYTFNRILQHYYPGTVLATRPFNLDNNHTQRQLGFWVPTAQAGVSAFSLWSKGQAATVLINTHPVKTQASATPRCLPVAPNWMLPGSLNQLAATLTLPVKNDAASQVWLTFGTCGVPVIN